MKVEFWLCIDLCHMTATMHIGQCPYVRNRKKDAKTMKWQQIELFQAIIMTRWYIGELTCSVSYCGGCCPETHFN